jgi:5-methylcytosine-specific restriction endonuclease McrA
MTMREPCKYCNHPEGRIEIRNGQDCVFCLKCGKHNYNAPKTETGRDVRSLRTRPDVKPNQRARILDRDAGQCIICHTTDRQLDLGHLVSVVDAKRLGWSENLIYDDENLATMCAPCNSGYSAVSINPRIFAALVVSRVRQREAA